jgi:4-amino-4-deoxy-L-arabinose transferase-like glycosyltransferase
MIYLKKILNSQAVLPAVLLLSVGLRIASAIYMGNSVTELPGTFDQISYHNLAVRILDGHGFSFAQNWWPATMAGEPTAHWSFLYTFYLTAVYTVFGPNPLAARLIQAIVVGIVQPLLAYRIGRKAFGESAGLIAAALTAGYIYFFYYAGALMTESFYISAILASIYVCLRIPEVADEKRQVGAYLLLGLILAYAVLLRQLFLLIVPFLLLWLWWQTRRQQWLRSGLKLFIPLAVIGVMILPFTIFNYARFERFVLLNTNAGYAFFFGNHPVYGTKFVGILQHGMGTYGELIPQELLGLDEAALDQALLKRGLEFITQDPVRYLLLSASRIPVYFQFWPSPDSGSISNISRVGSFGILWPLMLYGLWRAYAEGHLRSISQPLVLLVIFSVAYTGIHLLTWALIRYRLPVDAVLLIPASLGAVDLIQRIGSFFAAKTSAQRAQ